MPSFLLLRLWWPSGGCGRNDGWRHPHICSVIHPPSKYSSLNWRFWISWPCWSKCSTSYSCSILEFLWPVCKTASLLIFFQSSLCLYSSVWVNPGFSDGGSQIHQHDISQTGANSFPQKKVSSTQVPAVCFDLGNEWDDFDDENLLRASEALLTSCPANANPCHFVEEKIPGRESWFCFSCRARSLYVFLYAVGVTSAAPVFLHHSQVKACGTTTSRPLGYVKSFMHVPLPQQSHSKPHFHRSHLLNVIAAAGVERWLSTKSLCFHQHHCGAFHLQLMLRHSTMRLYLTWATSSCAEVTKAGNRTLTNNQTNADV